MAGPGVVETPTKDSKSSVLPLNYGPRFSLAQPLEKPSKNRGRSDKLTQDDAADELRDERQSLGVPEVGAPEGNQPAQEGVTGPETKRDYCGVEYGYEFHVFSFSCGPDDRELPILTSINY